MISRRLLSLRGVTANIQRQCHYYPSHLTPLRQPLLVRVQHPSLTLARLRSSSSGKPPYDEEEDLTPYEESDFELDKEEAEAAEEDLTPYELSDFEADIEEAEVAEEAMFAAVDHDPDAPHHRSVGEMIAGLGRYEESVAPEEKSAESVFSEKFPPAAEPSPVKEAASSSKTAASSESGRRRPISREEAAEILEAQKKEAAKMYNYDETVVKELAEKLSSPDVNLTAVLDKEIANLFQREVLKEEEVHLMQQVKAQYETRSKSTKEEEQTTAIEAERIREFYHKIPTGPSERYSPYEIALRAEHQRKLSRPLGSSYTESYRPRHNINSPPNPTAITVAMLTAAGAHLGHEPSRLRKGNLPFILGEREGIHIIDMEKTVPYLRRACRVVSAIAERGGVIVFLGTRDNHDLVVVDCAQRMKANYVTRRWIPGALTNLKTVIGMHPVTAVDMEDNPVNAKVPKNFVMVPDLVIVLNPVENRAALNECKIMRVPTIGIIDTDSEPTLVTYPIPANDDSLRSVEFIAGVLSRAGEIGQYKRMENAEREILPSFAGL
ncbi:ribosomal protein S2, flavodoxin-like domain-containing protein [Myxozyma melibiosi]|uniref:Ribosomal protein S2, flavodoxin-like domain-containing protein n=1 Tax=Myxozyma melibiosi TaxID=54550 RepID=A0ABR1F8I5_9ASCO